MNCMSFEEEKVGRIGDLVEIPEIKTVIQLEDLKDPQLSRMILETFVLTQEVLDNLKAILTSLSGNEGRGIFLKGHFGSGKSHFLGMLSLLLKSPQSWEVVTLQSQDLVEFERGLERRNFLVVEVSLVQYRASEFLENIILESAFNALGNETQARFDTSENRHAIFSRLKDAVKDRGYIGMVLLVDELSEFLRSKADARAYNEEIRFLQYLGEEAGSFPFWVIATLQEWIEETGEIHQDTFNKIKDRYRVRLSLGRAHIEELVSERLIRHKKGAEPTIEALFDQLKSYFPTFPVTRDRFARLYPVHPATSRLLDRLKALFSEHRGVVDFIHFRLKGDPERHIPSMLDSPAQALLTPEIIFDHFIDRIRESAETQVYVERVFEGYQEETPELFQEQDQQKIAIAAIKLLILFAISPSPFKYTVRHMAEMILFPITQLDTDINYQFLHDILDRMAKEGSYVKVEPHEDPLKSHYSLDLKADISGVARRRIRQMAAQIFAEDRKLFTKLAPMVETPYLPLANWFEKSQQHLTLQWQHTRRGGTLQLRPLDDISAEQIDDMVRRWLVSEEDFFVMVGTPHRRDQQFENVRENLLPGIREKHQGKFLFWVPAGFDDAPAVLKEVLAAILIREGLNPDLTEKDRRTEGFLQGFIEGRKDRVIEAFHRCYFHGVLLWDENQAELSRFGYLTQEKFLLEFVRPLLERCFPRHTRIQPYMSPLAPSILKEMLKDFLSSGVLVVDDSSKRGLRDVLEGLLKPMGLVKKNGKQYELQVNPKQNELVRRFFREMGERETVPFEEMYWAFRKGEYGLLMPHFEILVLALLFSGNLVAYKGMIRKGPAELARTGIKGVTSLGKGEVLAEPLQEAISRHPLVSRKFKNAPITLALQEELWLDVKSQKAAALEGLASLKSRIQWVAGFEAFKNMPWDEVLRDMDDLSTHWEAVKVSLSSRDGLERFIRAAEGEPFLEKKLENKETVERFLAQTERLLFVYRYVTDQMLVIPAEDPYVQEDTGGKSGIQEGPVEGDYGRLRRNQAEILRFFGEKKNPMSDEALEVVFNTFQRFQDVYTGLYAGAHGKERGEKRFQYHEKLMQSKHYNLLKRLDQLEMVSVEHNRRSIEQDFSSVLVHRCLRSPQEYLRGQPGCSCGFQLDEKLSLKPVKEIEEEIDLGISETLLALKAPTIQEKIIPYLEGLDLVGKENEADAVRRFLDISPGSEALLGRLDKDLTSQVIRHINGAFHGKVVVVERDVDRLYKSLVHRKYTLSQTRKIIGEWLEQETLSEDTFFHFVGSGDEEPADKTGEMFREFLEGDFAQLASIYRRIGHGQLVKATLALLWADEYKIPAQEIVGLFPTLERDLEGEDGQFLSLLMGLGRTLKEKKPSLFESMISQVEEDSSFIQTLWSTLSNASPSEIFKRESIFPLILREAFERIISGRPRKGVIQELLSSDDTLKGHYGFQERKGEMLDVLETYLLFQEKVSGLKSPENLPPEKFSRWESVFVEKLSPLPALRERLKETLVRTGIQSLSFLKEEERDIRKRREQIVQDFRAFYHKSFPVWENGEGPRPIMIEDVPALVSKKRQVPDHDQRQYILMDGMRWDLWERIKKDFFEKASNLFRVVREGAIWAHLPTDTSSQLLRFEEAFSTIGSSMENEDSFWKISGIDEKIHSEKGPLPHLFGNVISYLEIDWLHRLRRLSPRTLMILFSDHGFVENRAFDPSAKYESTRYIHGKDSPFEVIVPWAWVMRL